MPPRLLKLDPWTGESCWSAELDEQVEQARLDFPELAAERFGSAPR